MSLNPENIVILRDKLSQYQIEKIIFIEKPSNVPGYPQYDISGYIDGYHVQLGLHSCVFDKAANVLGMKLYPTADRNESVSFHLSIINDDLPFLTPFLDINLIKQKSLMVDDINTSIPFDTDMSVAMFYESFTFLSGTFLYNNKHYEIDHLNDQPIFNLSFYAQQLNPKYYSKGKSLLKILHKNDSFKSDFVNGLNNDLSLLKVKVFEQFFIYHMEKNRVKMNIMPIEELFLMEYEDIIRYIKVQQMSDI